MLRTYSASRPLRTVFAAAAGVLCSCGDSGRPVVGVASSVAYLDAARLAFHDHGAGGDLPADSALRYEGTSSATPALRMARELLDVPGLVAVVGHSNSAASLATAPLYNEREVVQLAPQSSAPPYSSAGPFSFRLVPPDDRQGSFLAERVRSLLPEDGRIAILYVNDDYGRGLRRAVKAALDTAIVLAVDRPFTEDETTTAQLDDAFAELRVNDPDAVLWLARAPALARHIGALRAAVGDVPVLGGDAVASVRQRAIDADEWREVYFVDFVDMDGSPALREFSVRYRERFGRTATGPDALTYDAVRLLLTGVDDGAATGPALRRYLASLGGERPAFEGITGPISFDAHGDVARGYVLEPAIPTGR